MPICHCSRRRLARWGSLDLFGSLSTVPLLCSEQDGLNHPDAGRVVERPTPAPVTWIVAVGMSDAYPDGGLGHVCSDRADSELYLS